MTANPPRPASDHSALEQVRASRRDWEKQVAEANQEIGHLAVTVDLGGVRAERVAAPTSSASDRLMIHLHGGGYVSGSAITHRQLGVRLSRVTGSPVVVLEYRLAPEHPCPAAVDDALGAYRHLLRQGVKPRNIAIGGDSAGGGVALAMLTRLNALGLPMPAAGYLMSPWLDLTMSGASMWTHAERDTSIARGGLVGAAELYLQGRPALDVVASPLFADLSGLPPLLVQVGSEEILLDDAVRLVDLATAAGVDATLNVFDGMQHLFQTNAALPESVRALDEIAAFVRRVPSPEMA